MVLSRSQYRKFLPTEKTYLNNVFPGGLFTCKPPSLTTYTKSSKDSLPYVTYAIIRSNGPSGHRYRDPPLHPLQLRVPSQCDPSETAGAWSLRRLSPVSAQYQGSQQPHRLLHRRDKCHYAKGHHIPTSTEHHFGR